MTASKIPSELIAGDTWAWTTEYGDYPAPTWAATVYLRSAGSKTSFAAVANGSSQSFSVPAATTADIAPGRYQWTTRVSDGVNVFTVDSGWVEVKANPAIAGNYDPRSPARKLLDAVQATLQQKASADQLAMSIGGRSISRIPLPELLDWETRLKTQVATEEAGSKSGLGRNIGVRFKR